MAAIYPEQLRHQVERNRILRVKIVRVGKSGFARVDYLMALVDRAGQVRVLLFVRDVIEPIRHSYLNIHECFHRVDCCNAFFRFMPAGYSLLYFSKPGGG